MAHFAILNSENEVIDITVVANEDILDENGNESEQVGINFIKNLRNDQSLIIKQTSYNTRRGKHWQDPDTLSADQTKALRKNHAGVGMTYDPDRDAFIPIKEFNSWVLNETTCSWEAPVPYPDDGNTYIWNEETLSWDLV